MGMIAYNGEDPRTGLCCQVNSYDEQQQASDGILECSGENGEADKDNLKGRESKRH